MDRALHPSPQKDRQQQFANAIEKNLNIWLRRTEQLNSSNLNRFVQDHQTILRAAKFGLTLERCKRLVGDLFLHIFPLVERLRTEQQWLPLIQPIVEISCGGKNAPMLQFRYAKALYLAGDYGGAQRRVEAILTSAESDPAMLGNLHILLCDCLRLQNQYRAAEQHVDRAITLLIEQNDRTAIATAYNAHGIVSANLGHYTTATSSYKTALTLEQQIGDPVRQARVLSNLGRVATAQGDYKQAQTHYATVLKLLKNSNSEVDFITAYINLGNVQYELQQLDSAYASFMEAKTRLQPHLALTFFEALVETNLGVVTQAMGDHKAAIPMLQNGIAAWKKRDDLLRWANTSCHLAISLAALGETGAALSTFEQGVQTLEAFTDTAPAAAWLAEFRPQYQALRQQLRQ